MAEQENLCWGQQFLKILGTWSGPESTKHKLLMCCCGRREKCIPGGLHGRSLNRTGELGLTVYLALKLEGFINVWCVQFEKHTKEPHK